MPAQYLFTSRLANVIQLITLGRQTGILRVYRGQGAAREVGQIQFVDGQPAAGLLAELIGNAAIRVLSNWGECYYAFDEVPLEGDVSAGAFEADGWGTPYGASPAGDPGWAGRSTSLPSGGTAGTNTSWPSYGRAGSPSFPTLPPDQYGPAGGGFGTTGTLAGRSSQPGAASGGGPTPGYPQVTPRRTAHAGLSDPLPLDRRERMILLLVDGRRSITDLSRLTRRNEGEVYAVLTNLRMLGLIE
jgi:hypothetical protein